jgi:hypothetical protein
LIQRFKYQSIRSEAASWYPTEKGRAVRRNTSLSQKM